MSPTLADIVDAIETAYPPELAEPWDAVGLVCGDPAESVDKVLVCVDPVQSTVDEALAWGAGLVLAHHPLLLRGVHGVPANTDKGRLVHELIRGGAGLLCAHTNADSADPGVSDALAAALGLEVIGPLDARPAESLDVLSVTVPVAHTETVLTALMAAGAGGRINGRYQDSAWLVEGTAQFRALPSAQPVVGAIGQLQVERETRINTVLPRSRRSEVIAALRAAHPYQSPAFDLHEQVDLPSSCGIGRIGELPQPEVLSDFVNRVSAGLPQTAWGVRAAGDPDRLIRRVAVCGGAGDSLLSAATKAGVDAYVTADLRHHPAGEHLANPRRPALIDVAHWASEWPWCAQAADVIRRAFPGTVEVRVSDLRTDPWTLAVSAAERI